jgi:hypothetical protein
VNVPLVPIRCPRPQCDKKLGEGLEGTYIAQCPRCGWFVTVVRLEGKTVKAVAISPMTVDDTRRPMVYR